MTTTRRASRSSIAYGDRGVAAAGSPQAVETALDVLGRGGKAVDAAVAATAVQCVVEFPWCGIGGDLFVLVDDPDRGVLAINGSGAAPRHRPETGPGRMPRFGPLSVAVPGFVATQEFLLGELGTMPHADLLEPAIALAETGVAVDARLAGVMGSVAATAPQVAALWAGTGRAEGDLFRQPELARTLATIGAKGADWFYRGEFADALVTHLAQGGGLLDHDDLAEHAVDWTEPVRFTYRDYELYQHPPVSLGLLMLAELRLLEQYDPRQLDRHTALLPDLMVRCKIAAFDELRDAARVDPADVPRRLDELSRAWPAKRLAALSDPTVPVGVGGGNDTTSLAVRDADGCTVTAIHSLFNTFGSREVVSGTGVVLNDRLAGLRLDDGPGPRLEPGRRPAHTLNAFVAKHGGRTVLAGATPGGRGQVQTNFQVAVNLLDLGLDPTEALDRPRWLHGTPRQPVDDNVLHVEAHYPSDTVEGLRDAGFEVAVHEPSDDDLFGCVTAVGTSPTGTYAVADHRRGAAAGAC